MHITSFIIYNINSFSISTVMLSSALSLLTVNKPKTSRQLANY